MPSGHAFVYRTDEPRARILSGPLRPGERLNLDQLRDELSVSVSSLREAVTRLVADGLIDTEEQRGYANKDFILLTR